MLVPMNGMAAFLKGSGQARPSNAKALGGVYVTSGAPVQPYTNFHIDSSKPDVTTSQIFDGYWTLALFVKQQGVTTTLRQVNQVVQLTSSKGCQGVESPGSSGC